MEVPTEPTWPGGLSIEPLTLIREWPDLRLRHE